MTKKVILENKYGKIKFMLRRGAGLLSRGCTISNLIKRPPSALQDFGPGSTGVYTPGCIF